MTVDMEEQAKTAVETLAVFCIYAVDFAINAGESIPHHAECRAGVIDLCVVQACCRSLIVDTLPISEQHLGSAWGEMPLFRKEFRTSTELLKPAGCLAWAIC